MESPKIYDVVTLCAAAERGEAFQLRLFWGHRVSSDGKLSDTCFSQWWPCQFSVDGVSYSSAEQFMMAEKARLFEDNEALEQILQNADPGKIKSLGRRVRGFEESAWNSARFDIVTRGNVAKFGQDGARATRARGAVVTCSASRSCVHVTS